MKQLLPWLLILFGVFAFNESFAQRTVLQPSQTSDEAIDIPYDNTTSLLLAVEVQSAIDELDSIIDTILGSNVTSFNGRTGAVVPLLGDYTTSIVAEGTNLYYTQARFDSAFTAKDTDDLSVGATNLYYLSSLFDADLATKTTTDLTEGTNLYYTQGRFDTAFGLKTTTDLMEGLNLYYTQARFDTAFGLKDSDDLAEGAVNLFYTEGRFDSSFSGKTTTDLTEGANLYYTEARVSANSDVALNTTHRGLTNNPHSTTAAQVGAYTIAQTDSAISTAITNHEAAVDPHPQYLTQTEGDGLYYSITNPSNFETPAQLDVRDTNNRARANHTGVQPINTLTQFDALLGAGNANNFYSIQMNGAGTAYVTFQEFEDSRVAPDGLINQTTTLEDYMNEDFVLPADGDYKISFDGAGSINATNSDLEVWISVDGGAAIKIYQKEGKDSGGGGPTFSVIGGGTADTGTDQLSNINYSSVFTLLSGTRNVTVQFSGAGAFANDEAALHFGTITIRRMKK